LDALVVGTLLSGGTEEPVCLSTPPAGAYGIEGIAVGVPVLLSADGVKRVVEWELANEERAALTDAARVESGDTLAFGGKTLHRGPVAFARELVRRDVDGLGHVGLAKSIEVDLLCATGQLDRVDFGYVGFEALGLAPNFRRRAEAGNLEVREGSCYTVATALRAVSLLPGVDRETVRERTGWPVTFADPERVEPPTDAELTALERVDPTRVRRSGFDTDRLSRA